ncbi:hypothetical protein KI387_017766, partial [Taxus chinensis]
HHWLFGIGGAIRKVIVDYFHSSPPQQQREWILPPLWEKYVVGPFTTTSSHSSSLAHGASVVSSLPHGWVIMVLLATQYPSNDRFVQDPLDDKSSVIDTLLPYDDPSPPPLTATGAPVPNYL